MAAPEGRGLRRELRFWEAIALSIGIMAPTAAMALNGTAVAARVGISVPLVFVLALVGVSLVMWGFVRLSRQFSHAGSVYAFSGLTLGPHAGFFAGWALLGTYFAFTVGSSAEVGLFFGQFLDGIGAISNPDWFWIAIVAVILVGLVAYGDVRIATRTLLGLEVVSVTLIVILMVVIFWKLATDGAPNGQTFTWDVFRLGPHSLSKLGEATVFAFLSWAGFEGAAALGEETGDPGRTIPAAIRRAVLLTGVFYVLCMLAQSLGFGATPQGAGAFASSASPLGDLGHSYIGSWFADLINVGAAISGFASALGTATGGSRILFALGRDGFVTTRLGETSRFGSPANALAVVLVIAVASLVFMRLNGTDAVNAFFYPGTIGVLSLIVAYVMCNVGGLVYLVGGRRVPVWEGVVPVLAVAFLLYVLWKQVYPVPAYPYDVFPYLVAAWLVVGLLIVLFVPGLSRSIGERLSAEAVS
jgi:amino acid transporter